MKAEYEFVRTFHADEPGKYKAQREKLVEVIKMNAQKMNEVIASHRGVVADVDCRYTVLERDHDLQASSLNKVKEDNKLLEQELEEKKAQLKSIEDAQAEERAFLLQELKLNNLILEGVKSTRKEAQSTLKTLSLKLTESPDKKQKESMTAGILKSSNRKAVKRDKTSVSRNRNKSTKKVIH